MANPTTNYGWPMPTSTDLVTDLPADFAAFGQPVDTSLKALNPETTLGDIAYRSATSNTNTRLGIGTNGQVLAVSGGVPAWTTTADVTPLTTKGDLFTFTTVDARIGVGANNTVLTADSAEATGLKWATPITGGGMTLINSGGTSLVGNTTVSSIPGTHKHLLIIVKNASAATAGNNLALRMNGDTGSNYRFNYLRNIGTTVIGDSSTSSTSITTGSRMNSTAAFGSSMDQEIWVYNYTDTDNIAVVYSSNSNDGNTVTAGSNVFNSGVGKYNCSAAITSITMISDDVLDAGKVYVYGVS